MDGNSALFMQIYMYFFFKQGAAAASSAIGGTAAAGALPGAEHFYIFHGLSSHPLT